MKDFLFNFGISIIGVLTGKYLGVSDTLHLVLCGTFAVFCVRGSIAVYKRGR